MNNLRDDVGLKIYFLFLFNYPFDGVAFIQYHLYLFITLMLSFLKSKEQV